MNFLCLFSLLLLALTIAAFTKNINPVFRGLVGVLWLLLLIFWLLIP